MYTRMVSEYVNALNSGTVPVIQNAWESVLENECEVSIAQAMSAYSETLSAKLGNSGQAHSEEDFEHALNEAKDIAVSQLGAISHVKDRDPDIYDKYFEQLMTFIRKEEQKVSEKNKIVAEA